MLTLLCVYSISVMQRRISWPVFITRLNVFISDLPFDFRWIALQGSCIVPLLFALFRHSYCFVWLSLAVALSLERKKQTDGQTGGNGPLMAWPTNINLIVKTKSSTAKP